MKKFERSGTRIERGCKANLGRCISCASWRDLRTNWEKKKDEVHIPLNRHLGAEWLLGKLGVVLSAGLEMDTDEIECRRSVCRASKGQLEYGVEFHLIGELRPNQLDDDRTGTGQNESD